MPDGRPPIRVWLLASLLASLCVAVTVWWLLPGMETPPDLSPPVSSSVSPPVSSPESSEVVAEVEPPPAAPWPRTKPVDLTLPSHDSLMVNPAWKGDLSGMVKRRLVRMLLVPNRTDYYLDHGRPQGLTAEYARELQRRLNARYKTGSRPIQVAFVPVTRDRLIPSLLEGLGDIAVANLTITPERQKLVDFSPPMMTDVSEIVVTGPNSPSLQSLEDLAGMKVQLRRSSSYWPSLEGLNARLRASHLDPVKLEALPEEVEDEDLLELLNAGLLPLVVVDDHKAGAWKRALPAIDLHDSLAVRLGGRIGWAFRKHSPELAKFLATFAKATARGTEFGNIVAGRYLVRAEQLRQNGPEDRRRFLDLLAKFRIFGDRYRFDPLLLAAQGFQESGLDQSKRSRAGAVGIMQMRPQTARDPDVGIAHIDRVDNNIEAGAKYLRHVIDTYFADPLIDDFNGMLFALAAYNAGPSRIGELRRRAARRGLDPNRWFGQVELEVARDIGRETVTYVGNIVKYYVVYRGLADQEDARDVARSLIVAR